VVRVVLLEPANARQARQGAARLVAVQDAKVGHADRQLAVRAVARRKDEAVRRAVHGLERERLLLHVELEHVVGVVLPVA